MDQYFDLTSDPRSGVAELVLNQPQRLNTIAPVFFTGLRDAVRELDDAGSADAFFTVQEIHIGLAADVGSLQRLPKVVPQGIARQMAYTGERLDAPRALATGLVNAVLPDAQALQVHATQLARQIAEKNPLAIAGSKLALNYARDHGTDESLQQMALLQSAIFDLGDIQRAIAAWKDKRAGQFDALAATPPP